MKLFEHIMGFIILSLGIVFVIQARLGAGAIDAFNFYVAELLNDRFPFITIGRIAIINGIFATLLAYLLSKDKKVFIGIIFIFIVGNFIDAWQWLFSFVPEVWFSTFLMRLILASVGVIVIAIGVSFTILSGYPPSPFERLLLVLDKKINNLSVTKIFIDGTYLIFAIILGLIYRDVFNQIGLFTIVLTFLTGFLVKHFSYHINRLKSRKGAIKNVTQ